MAAYVGNVARKNQRKHGKNTKNGNTTHSVNVASPTLSVVCPKHDTLDLVFFKKFHTLPIVLKQ